MRRSIPSPASTPKRLWLAAAAAALAGACTEAPAGYPRTLRQVPPAFHGGWDELNDCAGREPRITIAADSVYDFEVAWEVREARLLSPTEIDIVTVYLDPERGPTD
ncbi:MAG TPA: hypothetical protein VJS15_10695, partial [Allosphingosinicella sp.]|nr:hypothetical protein [Allosphingosinicella sp.]